MKGEKRKKAHKLSQRDTERLDAVIQQEDLFRKNVDISKEFFDIGDSIDEAVLFEEIEETTLTGLTVTFELLAILIEKHSEWFKNEESQRVFLSRLDMMSRLIEKIMVSMSDKGREIANWKSAITSAIPGTYRSLILKRVSFASAIAGLIAVAIQAEPFANVFNFILALTMYGILFLYIILNIANDGEILVVTFGKALAEIGLRLYDFIAVKTFFLIRNCEDKVRTRKKK